MAGVESGTGEMDVGVEEAGGVGCLQSGRKGGR